MPRGIKGSGPTKPRKKRTPKPKETQMLEKYPSYGTPEETKFDDGVAVAKPIEIPVVRKLVPVFDHSAPAGMEQAHNRKSLVQNGHRWSYAEFNKQTGKYEPEPHHIPSGTVGRDDINQKLDKLLNILTDLPTLLKEVQKNISDNIEVVLEGRTGE